MSVLFRQSNTDDSPAACFVDQTADEYHADRSRISRSQLCDFMRGSNLFYRKHVLQEPLWQQKSTDAMEFGTVFHAAVLEQKPIEEMVHVIPEVVLNAEGDKRGKAWITWKQAHSDKMCVKERDIFLPRIMWQSVQSSPAAMELLQGPGRNEQTIHWSFESIACRTRIDRLRDDCIVDLKTARSCNLNSINNSLESDGYAIQAAFYQMAVEAVTGNRLPFKFIFVEKNIPYRTVVVALGSNEQLGVPWIEQCRDEVVAALQRLQRVADQEAWRDPIGDQCITMNRPSWANYQWQLRGD